MHVVDALTAGQQRHAVVTFLCAEPQTKWKRDKQGRETEGYGKQPDWSPLRTARSSLVDLGQNRSLLVGAAREQYARMEACYLEAKKYERTQLAAQLAAFASPAANQQHAPAKQHHASAKQQHASAKQQHAPAKQHVAKPGNKPSGAKSTSKATSKAKPNAAKAKPNAAKAKPAAKSKPAAVVTPASNAVPSPTTNGMRAAQLAKPSPEPSQPEPSQGRRLGAPTGDRAGGGGRGGSGGGGGGGGGARAIAGGGRSHQLSNATIGVTRAFFTHFIRARPDLIWFQPIPLASFERDVVTLRAR